MKSHDILNDYEGLINHLRIKFKDARNVMECDDDEFVVYSGNALNNLRLSYCVLRLAEAIEKDGTYELETVKEGGVTLC